MDPRKVETPPRLAERLLRACLPRGARGLGMLGDLREDYYARVATGHRSRWWFWREALLLSLRYMNLSNDIRLAFRSLRRDVATSSVIILTLGAAMAASTIGFAFADLGLLRGLPVDDVERVVVVYGVDVRQSDGRATVSPANFADLKRRATTLEYFAAFQTGRATLLERGIPTSLDVIRTTADFFASMGQKPVLGRLLQRGDDVAGQSAVVVLAHQYWSRVHGADRQILGRSLFIDGRDRTIVGVASPELEFGSLALIEVWIPIELTSTASRAERGYSTMGRLAAGVSLEAARAEIEAISKSLVQEFPEENKDWHATVVRLHDVAFGRSFWVIMALFVAAVTLVMVIACANAASLVLAKAMARRREIALRSALGAGRFRLLRQALVEGAVLAMLSAALALPLAEAALRAIRALDAEPVFKQIVIDWHELGFIGAIALTTPVLFCMLPTLAALRLDLRAALQSGGVRVGGTATRGRAVLVGLQLSLAVTLLIAAGLSVRTAVNLTEIDPGIRTTNVLTFAVDVETEAAGGANPRQLVDETRRRLLRIPGVSAVHALEALPILGNERLVSLSIEGQTVEPGQTAPFAFANGGSAGALEALGLRLVTGRWLTEQEEARGDGLALVGQTAATKYFRSAASALGKTLTIAEGGRERRVEIVGVVTDVWSGDLELGPVPRVWTGLVDLRRPTIAVFTVTSAADLATAVRREMAAVMPMTPLEGLEPYATQLARLRASDQVVIGIFAGFAGLALVLAATGLYGLITYTVGQRLQEFGTRFALGARPRDVLLLVARQVLRLIAIGLAFGLMGGLAAGYGMRSVLYGVSSTDPVTIAGVVGVIATVALLAGVRPAIRAARVNLVDALRAE